MIRLFLLLAACFIGNCMKQQQQYDIRSSKPDNTAVNINAVRHIRSAASSSGEEGSCGQYQQLNYPCYNRHDTVCEDTGPAIENGYGNAVYSNCCCDTVCPNSDIIDDDEVSADDLNVTWLAHNHEQATLIVNWTISSSGSTSPIGYQLWVYMHRGDVSTRLRCICIPPNITSYIAKVSLTLSYSVRIKLFSISGPNVQPCPNSVNTVLSIKAEIPHYCWDLEGANVEKCGPMFASVPQNLTVTGTLVNQSSIMLQISWRPPAQYAPDIEAYKISINAESCYCNNGTTLQYVTMESADASSYIVKVSASSGKVISWHGGPAVLSRCCGSDHSGYILFTNYWSSYATATYSMLSLLTTSTTITTTSSNTAMIMNTMTTSTISTSPSASDIMVSSSIMTIMPTSTSSKSTTTGIPRALIIILTTLVTITVILLVILAITVYWLRQQKKQTVYRPAPAAPLETHPPAKVFIVTDSNLQLVRELCHQLASINIELVYYHYVENDRHNGPGQLGIPAWAQKCFNESDMVLFVCNRGFNIVWENKEITSREDSYTLIISTVRQLFEGCLREINRYSKYAVILLQESDHEYIPPLLKNVKRFPVRDQEALARYILEIPEYVAPPGRHNKTVTNNINL